MNKAFILFIVYICTLGFISCSKTSFLDPEDTVGTSIDPVTELKASATNEEHEIELSWTNPNDESLLKVEITYRSLKTNATLSPNPILVDAKSGAESQLTILVPTSDRYIVSAVAINKAGARSLALSVEISPYSPDAKPEEADIPVFLRRADTLMNSLVKLYLDGKERDIWSSNYPHTDGYWGGAAVIWGHGGAFSGYAALKEAGEAYPEYKTKYESLYDERLLTGIDQFRNRRDGRAEAYAVYPGDNDERYYDDNVWVGIDMVDLYLLTKNTKYLDRAKLVWKFVLEGTDDVMGGGVYWKEYGDSKNTCSTAPSAVLAAKMYLATNDETYLNSAKELYSWVKETLQDPSDFLYWDNVRLTDPNDPNSIRIDKSKFSYNAGQPMQAAALLYNITGESKYLTDAQNIAKSAYRKWFVPFHSYTLGEYFNILEPGHVWFQAIMFRGFIELYKIDGDNTYVNAYKKTLANAWLSNARNRQTNLINGDFRGGTSQSSWEILHQGACLEMLARLASLEQEGL